MVKSRPILFSTEMVEAILAGRKTMTRRVLKAGFDADGMLLGHVADYSEDKKMGLSITKVFRETLGTQAYFHEKDTDKTSANLFGCRCPFGNVGDVLWVKEFFYAYGEWKHNGMNGKGQPKWKFNDMTGQDFQYRYFDNAPLRIKNRKRDMMGWYPRRSLFMPKKAARIFLEITNIRVERLHDISEADSIAEGIEVIDNKWYKNYLFKQDDVPVAFTNPDVSFQTLWESINSEESWQSNPWVWVIEFKRKEVGDGQ